ncbi:hypothetical protein GALMADRAFT_151454 [Galerina marginata CBS 339.88]|uniref:NAD(P)-binding protein n=1 Tax=Galerina marginata (strain CBS 339.88) TaxID=685588 RepID=A0A067TXE8_GALM3|nr:hypothetical protein GALMADRAFT_151454 [Galerina marginata CBS 339.88]
MAKKLVWFVTGTSSGFGKALLNELLNGGHSVIATDRDSSLTDPLQVELEGKHDTDALKRAYVVKLDITKPDDIKAVFAKAVERFGRIDVVVNNAGYTVIAEVEACPMDAARAQFEVMFWGAVHISKEAVRIFREVNPPGEGGHIFNVSSAGGYSSQPSMAYYSSAKFALEGFTESLRKEMSPEWNIQVTIIEPGGFNTEWRGKNMTTLPPHPAYDTPNSPTKHYRSMFGALPFIGLPERAAKAYVALAEKKNDLPLRIQFGSDSIAVIRHTAMKTISDSEKWESISHSTNIDGIDPQEYTKNLLAALG